MGFTFHLDVVSAEAEIFAGPAEMLFVPTVAGELGILAHHAPLLAELRPGELRVRDREGRQRAFFVGGGLLEVQPARVTVLADTVERAEDIDEAAARSARERAEEIMRGGAPPMDLAAARAQLDEALARLRVVENMRQLSHGGY
ncbi:MAG: F0F1 ATP synthase subunit epsilon [Magnetococcus sp. WYHC-3]